MRIEVDTRGIETLVRELVDIRKRALPYAMRAYVNDAAFQTRKAYGEQADRDLTLRTPWTKRSMQVQKATDPRKPVAIMGSVADYMADLEEGKTEGKKGEHGVPIPAAAPGKRKARGRTPASNQLASIKLVQGARIRKGSVQSRNAAAISIAARKGGGVVFLNLGNRRKGLFRVTGTKRGVRIKKVWDLSKRRVTIPAFSVMGRTLEGMRDTYPKLAVKAVRYQLERALSRTRRGV
jgi:hypothetical protein